MHLLVAFAWMGKQYMGELHRITGAGTLYHLMVKGYYQGQLVRTEKGWIFSNQKQGIIEELSRYFGQVVENNEA